MGASMTVSTRTIPIAMTILLLFTGPLAAQAEEDDNLKTEWLSYTGTNLQAPTFLMGDLGPFVFSAPCDESGIGAVRFCETLAEEDPDDLPDQVAINLRDEWGMRASGIWEFRDAAGNILWSEAFCGHVNTFVPHEGNGGYPNSVELIVYPGVKVDEPSACGSPGTIGTATVIWRYNAPVFQ